LNGHSISSPLNVLNRLLIAIVLSAWMPPAGLAADWPQYRGPNLDGSTSETINLAKWPENGPERIWRVDTPTGFSSFAVAQGKAFTLVTRNDSDGVPREVCVAFDADTGKELWAQDLCMAKYDGGGDSGTSDNNGGDGPRSTPTIDGDRVFVYDSQLGFYCFRPNDGSVIWNKDIVKEFEGRNIRWQSAASPLLIENLVYIPGGGPGQSFLAFDKNTGEIVWKALDEMMTHATPVPATIHGVRQIVFFAQSGPVSVDPKTGEKLWSFPHPYKISTAASPVVFGDLVYCSAGYGIGAALWRIKKTDSGFEAEEVWRKKNELFNHWSTPLCIDGYLYGMFSFKQFGEGPMECVELNDGQVRWSQPGYGPGNVIRVGNNQLLALADDGHLVVIEPTPEAYKEIARAKVVDGKCWTTPTISNGRIYARSTKEGVCLDVSSP